jgi:hypothetical protein
MPFLNNLMIDTDTEVNNCDSQDQYSTAVNARPRNGNNSYYKTDTCKKVAIPNSCQIKYETARCKNQNFTSSKSIDAKKSSMPRQNSRQTSGSLKRKECRSRNNASSFKKNMSEKILETKQKHNNKLNSRNKVARFDLHPVSIESKTISQIVREKYSPNKINTRTRNIANLNEVKSMTMRTLKNDKKLISSLKNTTKEGDSRLATKHQNFVSISKPISQSFIETNMLNTKNKFLDGGKKNQTRNFSSSKGLCYS